MSWEKAQKYCREYHDDLSTASKEEAQLLSINPEVNHDYFWIGLYMVSKNIQKWSWSGGEDQKIDYWDLWEPNGLTENCGSVQKYSAKLHNAVCCWPLPFYFMENFELILHQNKTWDEALNYCRQNYFDLVSLRSQIYIENVINITITAQTAYVWTGLHFMAGHWFWVNGDNLQYKAWSAEGGLQCPAACAVELWIGGVIFGNCEEKLNLACIRKP